jgi:hypothetical protein
VNFCLQASLLLLNAKRSIYRLREVLEAPVNLDNSEVSFPVKVEVWNLNKILSNLCSQIAGCQKVNVQIRKILFHNKLYHFELSFHCRLNHLNLIFEQKVMVKTLKRVQNLNLNSIRIYLHLGKFRFYPSFDLVKLNHIFYVFSKHALFQDFAIFSF